MKKQIIIAVLLFVSLGIFSQDAVTEVKESTTKRVGDKVWFIKNIQTDSLLCNGNFNGLCQMRTSYSQEVEVVQADTAFPIDKVIQTRSTNQSVLLSENYRYSPKMFSITGLTYIHPVDQVYIKYDPKLHVVKAFSDRTQAEEINWRACFALIFIVIYGFICICTIPELVQGYAKEGHVTLVAIYITSLLTLYLSCFFFTTDTFKCNFFDTFVVMVIGAAIALVLGIGLAKLLEVINPTETYVISTGNKPYYFWYRFGMRVYTFIPFILVVLIIAKQSNPDNGMFDVSIVIGFYILCAAIYFGIKKLVQAIKNSRAIPV